MATRTWYLRQGFLDVENLYPGLDTSQGWTVDKKGATNYCRIYANTVRAAADFVTTEPTGAPTEGQANIYWGGYQVEGTYASGNWVFAYKVRCNSYYAQKGYLRMRLWKLDKRDYVTFTELTSGWVSSSLIEFTAANQYQTGTITWNSGAAIEFTSDYGIVLDIMWVTSASGGNNAAVVYFCEGEASGETLTSPDYTPAESGSTWTYGGEVSLPLLPESSLKLVRKYGGEVPLSLLPEGSQKLNRSYTGEIPVAILPEHGVRMAACPATEALISLLSEGAYEYVLPAGIFIYAGEVPLVLLPEGSPSLTRDYAGEIPLGFSPEHAESVAYRLAGELALALMPECSLKRSWTPGVETSVALAPEHVLKVILRPATEVSLGFSPEHAHSVLWVPPSSDFPLPLEPQHAISFLRSYSGDTAFSTTVESGYFFEWIAGKVWSYSGLTDLGILPEGAIKLIRSYAGEVSSGLTPEHDFAWVRAYSGELPLLVGSESDVGIVMVYPGEIPLQFSLWSQYGLEGLQEYTSIHGVMVLRRYSGRCLHECYKGDLAKASRRGALTMT